MLWVFCFIGFLCHGYLLAILLPEPPYSNASNYLNSFLLLNHNFPWKYIFEIKVLSHSFWFLIRHEYIHEYLRCRTCALLSFGTPTCRNDISWAKVRLQIVNDFITVAVIFTRMPYFFESGKRVPYTDSLSFSIFLNVNWN